MHGNQAMTHCSPADQVQRSWVRLRAHASHVVCGDLINLSAHLPLIWQAGAGSTICQQYKNGKNGLHHCHSSRMYGIRTRCVRSVDVHDRFYAIMGVWALIRLYSAVQHIHANPYLSAAPSCMLAACSMCCQRLHRLCAWPTSDDFQCLRAHPRKSFVFKKATTSLRAYLQRPCAAYVLPR
jgi:hypothetical protein